MALTLQKITFAAIALLAQGLGVLAKSPSYPEVRSDLQKYQDVSKCYPDVGEWICMFRNYYEDPNFGGHSKCLRYNRFGTYENFTTKMVFTFGEHGTQNTTGKFVLESSPCYTGKNIHSFTPDSRNGCSLWRRRGTLDEPNDCCEFIYDENCGSSPKYPVYEQSCGF
ncbi:uncharacterized protein [Dermacentor andersoni]|uniref:uncharacterized protein isoform X2 n=1 Tax=Dermacentor andersoni TaxID=34620 RepID=UPI00241697FD|nr:uncharacterized protein LOC129388121 isoform X2 [Dermacentor andersoni]